MTDTPRHFGAILGFRHLAARENSAILELSISSEHRNVNGTLHGGVIMAILDAAGLWTISDGSGLPPAAATVSLTCSFLTAARKDQTAVRATATISRRGRRLYFADIILVSLPDQIQIASAQGVYAISQS